MRSLLVRLSIGLLLPLAGVSASAAAEPEDTIARVKRSVVAVGTFDRTRSPAFKFLGTGFAVGDGTIVATNDHVAAVPLDGAKGERLVVLAAPVDERAASDKHQMRGATIVAREEAHDIALLRIDGGPLPPLPLGDSRAVREGRAVYFTGFPIGAVLGLYPATHRATVSSITPIAIPQGASNRLNAATARRLALGSFPVFQLDGTAYPGNSGSPVYEGGSGAVIGVINMVLVKATKESLLSQPSGIAYAIPAEHLRDLLAGLR
jgi:S1-C subfamily serine protease